MAGRKVRAGWCTRTQEGSSASELLWCPLTWSSASALPKHLGFPACCPGLTMTLGFQSTALNKVDNFSQISWIGRVCKNGSYWIFLGFLSFSPSEPWYLALSFSGAFSQCFAHCYLPHPHPSFLSHSSFCLGNASPSLKTLFKHHLLCGVLPDPLWQLVTNVPPSTWKSSIITIQLTLFVY